MDQVKDPKKEGCLVNVSHRPIGSSMYKVTTLCLS